MIGIVTVLYNSAKVLSDFFQSLEEQTYKDFILYIIDNKSLDNSLEVARDLMNKVNFKSFIIPQEENWGVAKGNNIGIQRALEDGCDYVLLSNNDVIIEIDCIERLFHGLLSMNASLAVPKIYYYGTDKILWCAGGYFRISHCDNPHRGKRIKDLGQYDKKCYTDYSPTCFMLIEKGVFERVGYMDENFFVYYDDADFVWRSLRIHKEKLAYIPTSVLWHKESYSTGGSLSAFYIRYYYRNRVFFARKHYTILQKIFFFSYLILQYFIRSRFCFNKEQRRLYKESCIEGWNYFNKKKNDYR